MPAFCRKPDPYSPQPRRQHECRSALQPDPHLDAGRNQEIFREKSLSIRTWAAAFVTLALCACGGGGGESSPTTRSPLPTLSQDLNPAGTRLDYRDRNYFPMAAGDTWTYDRQQAGMSTGRTESRSVIAGLGSDVIVSETSLGTTAASTYRRTSDGIVEVMPLNGSAPVVAVQLVGDLTEYPEPFYPVGSTRQIVRQGDWGADLDGDGISDSFRIEISQVFVGLESLTLPSGALNAVAHFRNVTSLTLQPSLLKNQPKTLVSTEEAWWAPGIGLVKADRSVVDSTGAVASPAYTLVLTGGTVAGTRLFAPQADGNIVKVSLKHNALVFDAVRNRYYASIPGSVPTNGNRIAVIDASNGAVSYPAAAIGSDPSAMGLSADGGTLYVGLNGSGEVVRLRLPDLAEISRTRLPLASFYGQLYAEKISVSPADASVVAVSMFRTSVSPRHGGVALIRNGVLQPTLTQDHTGSNLIAFDGSGQYVYGFNNETTEFGLRRIAVLPDGLRQELVVPGNGNFGSRTLEWSAIGLVLDNAVYRTPDLNLLGRANVTGAGCHPYAVPNRLVCGYSGGSSEQGLAVVDATSFVLMATPAYSRGVTGTAATDIVPGARGQVALRFNATYYNSPADELWLFNSTALQ